MGQGAKQRISEKRGDNEVETHIAYEVSITKMEKVDNEGKLREKMNKGGTHIGKRAYSNIYWKRER